MRHHHHVSDSDRGAVLIHVAIVIIALLAFSAFVVDYGVLWASRRQAQNAADAAALAGAIAFAFDSTDTSSTGPAALSARSVIQASRVWAQVPIADVFLGPTACPPGQAGSCVRVDVFRNQARGNPLPTYFGSLVGLTQQGVRATATAIVAVGNASDCLKPWGVIDKWQEHYPVNPGTWTATSIFNKYLTSGPNKGQLDPSIPVPDLYIPPTATDPGTGFRPFDANRNYTADYGRQFSLTVGDQTDFQFATGWFAPLALFDSRGGNDYSNNIKGCVGTTYKIGDQLDIDTEPGLKVGPTRQAVNTDIDSIVNQDPTAVWDQTINGGYGGVANSAYPASPRIVAVPLINPDEMAEVNKGGRTSVSIANIMGFFVEGYDTSAKAVYGRLMTIPGLKVGGAAPIGSQSAFMQAILLIR